MPGLKQALPAILITQNLRYWLILSWSFSLAYTVGWRMAVVWGAVAMACGIVRAEIERRLLRTGGRDQGAMLTIVATVNNVLWAVAPALAWNTGQLNARMIAVSLLLAGFLFVFTQFGRTLRHAVVASAPYCAVAVWFAFNLARPAEFWPTAICIMILGGAIMANVLFGRVHYDQIDRYQAKQALLITQLREARDTANAANAAKSAFLAMISHELRTPMNGVLGAAQLLDGHDLKPAQRRYVETIRTSGNSLLNLLNDILDFAKIESGSVDIEAEDINLTELIERLGAQWSAKARAKGLAFDVAIAADVPARIMGDGARLSRIVEILLSNATKFTDLGHLGVAVRSLRLNDERAHITIAVTDTGVGISAADRARLFAPFSQLDLSSTRRHGGAGLGLAIAHRQAELIGGSLEAKSEPGRGSTFTLSFDAPVADWDQPESHPASKPAGRERLAVR